MNKHHGKIIKQVMAVVLSATMLLGPVFSMQSEGSEAPAGLYSAGAVLMDADSGRILFSKNARECYAMASTTKIMTCILALELGEGTQVVTFSENAAKQPDVQMNAKVGEQYYLKDLLYSVMLESHNDSAVAVAEAIGGSEEAFTKLMDQKAEAIGCVKTNFVTPNGLDGTDEEGEHCTTAEDLANILRYCVCISSKAQEFIEITGADSYEFSEISGKRSVSCRNHNALLSTYEGAYSGKTGFTGKAGYCYAGAAKQGEKNLIIVLLGAGWYPHKSYKWKDAGRLLDYGFSAYEYRTVGKNHWEFENIPVENGMKKSVAIRTDAKEFQYLLSEKETVSCKVEYSKNLIAPVSEHTVVGSVIYELNGKIIEQFQIYTMESVEKSTFWNKAKNWIRILQDFVEILIKN